MLLASITISNHHYHHATTQILIYLFLTNLPRKQIGFENLYDLFQSAGTFRVQRDFSEK